VFTAIATGGASTETARYTVVGGAPAAQSISFTSTAPVNPPVGATYTPTATATSGLPVTFSLAAASGAVCTIGAANLVTFNATGSCVIRADQAGNASFTAAPQVTQAVSVVKADQTITFTAPGPRTLGDAPFTVSATSSSGLPVSFTVPGGGPCTISGATVTITAAGTCSITANQAGNAIYKAAPSVTRDVNIAPPAKVTPTISTQASAGGPLGTTVHNVATVSGGSSPTGSVTFRLFSNANCTTEVFTSTNNLTGGTATSGNFTSTAPGTYFWTAVYNGDANNNTATSACGAPNQSVVITKARPTISTQASAGGMVGTPVKATATLAGGAGPTGSVTFRLYSDASCSTQVFTSTNTLSGLTTTSGWFTPASPGTYRWSALYNGDANNNSASSPCTAPGASVTLTAFEAPAYTQTVSGDLAGPLTVASGQSVLINTGARVVGPVTVSPGGALTVVNASISRGVIVDDPSFLSICGSSISGPSPAQALGVSNAKVPIRIGDPATGCAGNRFAGEVNLTANLGGTFGANTVWHNATITNGGPAATVIKANSVLGILNCTGNTPAPINAGQTNTGGTKTGQCAGL
jgi:hypothetical protein